MSFNAPAIISDEGAIAEQSLAGIADQIPNWQPSDGGLVTPVAESTAVAIGTAIQALLSTFQQAYLGFAQIMLGLTPTPAALATTTSTWTVAANQLTVIPAGTEVDGTLSGGQGTFVVSVDTPVPDGATTVLAVPIESIETGPEQNGFTNPASTPLVGALAVSIDAPAQNGADAEDLTVFLNNAAQQAERLHGIPVTPSDWATFVVQGVPGVARCYAINRYNPGNPGVDTPGTMTLVCADVNGQPLTAQVKAAIQAYFASIPTPLNVTLYLADPGSVQITPVVAVKAAANVDQAALEQTVAAAIEAFLFAGTFDADSTAPGGWSQTPHTELTVFDISHAIDDIPGVAAVISVTLNGGTAPVALPGPVSLPALSGVPTVTVS